MQTLYKYYSSRFDMISYLDDPTMRISQIPSLNDPFEGTITNELLDKFLPKFIKHIHQKDKITRSDLIYTRKYVLDFINSFGIISMSETHRNLLMWAHYASEHKGICIGYRTGIFDEINKEAGPGDEGHILLRKVNYDSVLFDHEHIEAIDKIDLRDENYFEWIAERILTTKSHDWMYEKEHRYISHISRCDKIVIPKKESELGKRIKEILDEAVANNIYNVEHQDEKTILRSLKSQREKSELIDDANVTIEQKLLNNKDIMFLSSIKKQDIKSIYIGHRYDHNKKDDIFKAIENDRDLQHINVYDYSLSKNRYELTADKVMPR